LAGNLFPGYLSPVRRADQGLVAYYSSSSPYFAGHKSANGLSFDDNSGVWNPYGDRVNGIISP
jgi:rare lipoprotein A (peptidoglycan hydrolase)